MIRGNIEIKCMEGINPTVVNLLLRFKEFNGEGGKKTVVIETLLHFKYTKTDFFHFHRNARDILYRGKLN